MVDKRLKALSTIHRLATYRLEAETVTLTALRGKVAELQGRKAELRYQAAHQGRVGTAESAPYVARFLRNVRAEELRIDTEITRLNQEASGHERIVRERFREAKTMSVVEEQHRSKARAHAEAQERAMLDDLAVMRRKAP